MGTTDGFMYGIGAAVFLFSMLWLIPTMTGATITINHSYEQELATCRADNEQILANRDVYCVREFGKPDNMWQWVFGSIWMLGGAGLWIYASYRAGRDNSKGSKGK